MLWRALAASAAEPQEVVFPSGSLQLYGFVFKPQGDGPFPAVLYNDGSEKRPGTKPEIGEFFAANGYVLFIPHRRAHGRSPGGYIMDALDAEGWTRRVLLPRRSRLGQRGCGVSRFEPTPLIALWQWPPGR